MQSEVVDTIGEKGRTYLNFGADIIIAEHIYGNGGKETGPQNMGLSFGYDFLVQLFDYSIMLFNPLMLKTSFC